jgi:hypothetical protein
MPGVDFAVMMLRVCSEMEMKHTHKQITAGESDECDEQQEDPISRCSKVLDSESSEWI